MVPSTELKGADVVSLYRHSIKKRLELHGLYHPGMEDRLLRAFGSAVHSYSDQELVNRTYFLNTIPENARERMVIDRFESLSEEKKQLVYDVVIEEA